MKAKLLLGEVTKAELLIFPFFETTRLKCVANFVKLKTRLQQ